MQKSSGFGHPFGPQKPGFRLPENDISKRYMYRVRSSLELRRGKFANKSVSSAGDSNGRVHKRLSWKNLRKSADSERSYCKLWKDKIEKREKETLPKAFSWNQLKTLDYPDLCPTESIWKIIQAPPNLNPNPIPTLLPNSIINRSPNTLLYKPKLTAKSKFTEHVNYISLLTKKLPS